MVFRLEVGGFMSKLVAWDYSEFEHMFENVQEFANSLGVKIRYAQRWINNKKINNLNLEALKKRRYYSTIEKPKEKDRGYCYKLSDDIINKRRKRSTFEQSVKKEELDGLILNGYTVQDLAKHEGILIGSMKGKLRNYYGTINVYEIKNSLTTNK